jgi:long-chain acyl-CoA synthetase
VAPQPLENKLKESPFIEQIMIVGAEQKFVGALIVPNFEVLKEWMKDHHIVGLTDEEIIKHPSVISHLERIVETYNAGFNQVERVKRFALLPKEWGIESGELTPKLSLKRKVIADRYKEMIEGLYV